MTESRQGVEIDSAPCWCGLSAARAGVYREQYMRAETGPRDGRKNEPPRGEKSYRQEFAEYAEAAADVDYAYSRRPERKPPDLYKEASRRARRRDKRVRA